MVWRCEKSQDGFEDSCQPHPMFPLLFDKVLDLGKSCPCLEGLIDIHSAKLQTQPRDNSCAPGSGKGLVQRLTRPEPRTRALPVPLPCRTFLVRLVDSCDLLVVPRGHDFDEDALVCAGPLEESGMARCCGCQRWPGTRQHLPTSARQGAALIPGLPRAKSPCPANGLKGWSEPAQKCPSMLLVGSQPV